MLELTEEVLALNGPAVALRGSEPVECQNDTLPLEKSYMRISTPFPSPFIVLNHSHNLVSDIMPHLWFPFDLPF
jgi:hypothetical protein